MLVKSITSVSISYVVFFLINCSLKSNPQKDSLREKGFRVYGLRKRVADRELTDILNGETLFYIIRCFKAGILSDCYDGCRGR